MSFSTPLFCVSLISLYSALRVLNLMKLLHLRNPRYKTGLTIVRLVSSLPVTVHISQFLLGLWTILTLTFTYLRSACSLPPTSAITKTLPLKHADTNVISLLLPFCESFLLIQSCLVTDFPTFHLPVLHLRLYHVLPSPHLLPSSLPDLSNRPQGQHNLPTRRRLRPLVHNTLFLQVLALTPNDPAYPVRAAPPQVDPLDTCPSFLTTPDPWDPPPPPLIVPAVVRIIKVKVLIKVHLKAKTNFPLIGHLSTLVPLKALPRTLLGPPLKALPRVPIKASLMAKVSLHLLYTHLLPTPHLMVIHKTSLPTNFTPIASPAASLGILSGSQSGSSSFLHPRLGHPSHSYTSFHHSSLSFLLIILYSRCSLFTPDSSFSLCSRVPSLYQLYSFLSSLFLYLPTFLPPFVASLGILSGSSLSLLLPPFPLFPLVTALYSPSIFSLYSRLPPPLPLSSALVVSQGVCPKWLGPTWQHLL